jgi:predicted ATP-dependent serine protease
MLNGVEEFVLLDEQKTVFETIIRKAMEVQISGKKVLIVKGGPGTGKSVIAINALARLMASQLNVQYVTANAAPRDVFKAKLKNILKGFEIRDRFSGSGSFTENNPDSEDVLIVDEAHRLRMKSGMFKNMGESQTKEIIDSAKLSVFFIDEAQKVTWSDVGEISRIKMHAAELGADVEIMELVSQFRCNGSDDYMAWLDGTLGVQENIDNYFTKQSFDFQIFDFQIVRSEYL